MAVITPLPGPAGYICIRFSRYWLLYTHDNFEVLRKYCMRIKAVRKKRIKIVLYVESVPPSDITKPIRTGATTSSSVRLAPTSGPSEKIQPEKVDIGVVNFIIIIFK